MKRGDHRILLVIQSPPSIIACHCHSSHNKYSPPPTTFDTSKQKAILASVILASPDARSCTKIAGYYQGGRTMSYSNTDECFDGGRTMYSNTTDECFDAGRHGHEHGHGHGHGHGGRTMYSNTTEECYDSGRHDHGGGGRRPAVDDCGYGGRQAVYSEEYSMGGDQGYYRKEEKTHKNRERMGEVGGLATGAFAMYEGYEAKKDPAHAQRHKIEAGLAGAAALGAGGYAYHEHRDQKEATYGANRVPQHNHYCN